MPFSRGVHDPPQNNIADEKHAFLQRDSGCQHMVLAFFHYRPGPVGCLFTMGAKDHLSDFALRG